MDIMEFSTALSYTVTRTTVAYSTVGSSSETETENESTRWHCNYAMQWHRSSWLSSWLQISALDCNTDCHNAMLCFACNCNYSEVYWKSFLHFDSASGSVGATLLENTLLQRAEFVLQSGCEIENYHPDRGSTLELRNFWNIFLKFSEMPLKKKWFRKWKLQNFRSY